LVVVGVVEVVVWASPLNLVLVKNFLKNQVRSLLTFPDF
jgi:hypothetical protein